ncbi:hypothetical protein [Alkalibacterium sp. AK22]|uniref:hypothetical protein n=1 Tax=Alkalibacterium sp. AK22 TaxID=1229520 RepID=UPI00054F883A|nr:hypothetical protein [Alkalibacterium sp. AK22]
MIKEQLIGLKRIHEAKNQMAKNEIQHELSSLLVSLSYLEATKREFTNDWMVFDKEEYEYQYRNLINEIQKLQQKIERSELNVCSDDSSGYVFHYRNHGQ